MSDNDFLPRDRRPVGAKPQPATAVTPQKVSQAEKLMRRLAGMAPGRYEMIITIGEEGIVDWSVRMFGKVEQ